MKSEAGPAARNKLSQIHSGQGFKVTQTAGPLHKPAVQDLCSCKRGAFKRESLFILKHYFASKSFPFLVNSLVMHILKASRPTE
jgi:hypothetical protein